MSQFAINTKKTRQAAENLKPTTARLDTCADNLDKSLGRLNAIDFHYADEAIRACAKSIRAQARRTERLRFSLEKITELYESTERSIVSKGDIPSSGAENSVVVQFSSIEELLRLLSKFGILVGAATLKSFIEGLFKYRDEDGVYRVDSILFDKWGQYGGDQGDMIYDYQKNFLRRRKISKWIKEYFPDMTPEQISYYLARFNSEGCGYIAMTNTILMQYENDPKGFEKTFGFPMYDSNGDLNYDRLALDLYVYTDKNNLAVEFGNGTYEEDWQNIMSSYLGEKGVKVRTDIDVEVTPENFRQITESGGKVIVGLRYDNIYNNDGAHYINGGHAMTVTGCTDDGRLIVSSWGKQYYINASELDGNDRFAVIYFE
ncbi:MAG: hypothetical protein IIU14_03125 [Ruminococcus sp.]|nr:hypothetical protein [Ruminococcus sp.]